MEKDKRYLIVFVGDHPNDYWSIFCTENHKSYGEYKTIEQARNIMEALEDDKT